MGSAARTSGGLLALAVLVASLPFGAPARAQEAAAAQDVTTLPASFFAGFRPQNAYEMVLRIPGFTFDEGEGGSRELADAGNVLIDGKRPSLEGKSLPGELGSIPAGSVVRIEMIRNGARSIDMGGWELIANVVVRRSGAYRGTVSVEATLNPDDRWGGSSALNMSRRIDDTTFDVGFDAGRSPNGGTRTLREQIRVSTGDVTSRRSQMSGGSNDRFSARSSYDTRMFGGRLRANGAITYSTNVSFTTSENLLSGITSVSDASGSSSRNRNASVSYNRDLGSDLNLDAQLSHSDSRSSSRSASSGGTRLFVSQRESGSRNARLNARFNRWDKVTLEGGVNANLIWQGGSSARFVNGVLQGLPSSSVDAERLRLEAFGSATWRPLPKLTLEGGLRLDSTTVSTEGPTGRSQTFDLIRPTLEATWRFTNFTEATISLDRGVEPVNISNFISTVSRSDDDDEDTVVVGNTALVPETDWTLRARFQRRFNRRGLFAITATHIQLAEIVDRVLLTTETRDPVTGIVTTRTFEATGNIGDGTRQDVNLNFNLPLDRYGLVDGLVRLQATWRTSDMTDPFTSERRRFSGETPLSWSLGFSKDFNEGAFRTGFDASGGQMSVSFRRSEISFSERALFLSAYAEYRVTPKLTVRLDARDLTSRLQTTQRDIYNSAHRVGGVVQFEETVISQAGPSFELNVRRSF